jgi:hypothetical protein
MRYVPATTANESDVALSRAAAELHGLAHTVVDVDFDHIEPRELIPVARAMPLAAHLSVGYLALMRAMAAGGAARVWLGQNADAVYNLGPTARFDFRDGKSPTLKRYLLSREYFTSLPDIAERSVAAPLWRLLGYGAAKALSRRYAMCYRQPANFEELFHGYQASPHYTALRSVTAERRQPVHPALTALEARERLFDYKLSSYLLGGDHRAITSAAGIHGISCMLPYSSAGLVHFFRSLETTWRDVLSPKRFIRAYLEELIGDRAYRELYGHRTRRTVGVGRKKDDRRRSVLGHTRFGQGLLEEVRRSNAADLQAGAKTELQDLLRLYWRRLAWDRARRTGIEIRE